MQNVVWRCVYFDKVIQNVYQSTYTKESYQPALAQSLLDLFLYKLADVRLAGLS